MVIVVMGVSGVGKTTIGRHLARQLEWDFHDADDVHEPSSIERMRSGRPLTDQHRASWLAALARLIGDHVRAGRSMVLACSALSQSHRAALFAEVTEPDDIRLVHLYASMELLRKRIASRTDHFFPPELLPDQLAVLEAPDPQTGAAVLSMDAARPVDELVAAIRQAFRV